jgi:hypothetical protein
MYRWEKFKDVKRGFSPNTRYKQLLANIIVIRPRLFKGDFLNQIKGQINYLGSNLNQIKYLGSRDISFSKADFKSNQM